MRISGAFALALAVAALPAWAAGPSSGYTKHDYPACKRAAFDGVIETRVCTGYGGIPVRWFGEPDGTSIEFGSKGGADGLGEDFATVGSTIEWRGPVRSGGVIVPVAAIVRVDVGRSISGPIRRRLLVIHKLEDTGSCIAAIVDAGTAGANERARKAADEIVPTFRCGVDARKAI